MSNEKMDIDSNVQEETQGDPVTKELIVLGCYKNVFLCRERCPNGRVVTFKTTLNDGIPGSIITVNPTQEIKGVKYPEISGTLVSVRYCAKDLGLEPIPMVDCGKWSPKDEAYGGNGGQIPKWFKAIARRGERTRLAFQPTGPFGDPFGQAATMNAFGNIDMNNPESLQLLAQMLSRAPGTAFGPVDNNPINKANILLKQKKIKDARKILYDLLAEDLRCLDAHAILGEIEVEKRNFEKALLHYQMGASIGELSLEKQDPDPVVAWGHMENRPFLRCFYGTGVCTWTSRNFPVVKQIFTRLLSYNPADNLGIRRMLPYLEGQEDWDDYHLHQLMRGNTFQGIQCMKVMRPDACCPECVKEDREL